jgi:hypothetical protein
MDLRAWDVAPGVAKSDLVAVDKQELRAVCALREECFYAFVVRFHITRGRQNALVSGGSRSD